MKSSASRSRMDVDLEELDGIIDGALRAPLSESDGRKLKTALHAMAEKLLGQRTTEKTKAVLPKSRRLSTLECADVDQAEPAKKGHGRNGAGTFTSAARVTVRHETLQPGDPCPECGAGKVYRQKEPKALVRIIGQAPLEATVFEMERLRCNGCGQLFAAAEPEGVGPEKYDATAAAMIAQLRYGSGVPFKRLERLQANLGIPLPAATQWELIEEVAEPLQAATDELVRQAAQGEVMHNDDTGMRILHLAREPSDERTGVFTTGIVSTGPGWKVALYVSGSKHAGENLAEVLKHRVAGLRAPIQMCDALSRNTPKTANGVKILLANCMAHGRRQFVDVAANFPRECGYVLESLSMVYGNDALAREQGLDAEKRLRFHQQYSAPLMQQLHEWLTDQLDGAKTEPNSGLGKAISYLLNHWLPLTLFLREEGAPLDNNVVERALKKAILHRKNSLFYKTLHGARVGDLYMSLIHTCELNGANPFDYLTELQRHSTELKANPSAWMPWNYRETLLRLAAPAAA
jgi:transposase